MFSIFNMDGSIPFYKRHLPSESWYARHQSLTNIFAIRITLLVPDLQILYNE